MLLESKKLRAIVGWSIVFFLILSGISRAQQNPSKLEVQDRDAAAELAEIEELRQKLGGGVTESLGDLIDPKAAQKEFAREFKRLSQESGKLAPANSKTDLPKRLIPLPRGQSPVKSRLAAPRLLEQGPRPKPTGRLLYQSIARKLDGITADLEESGNYEEADSMRDMAESYWKKARKIEPVQAMSERLDGPLGIVEQKK